MGDLLTDDTTAKVYYVDGSGQHGMAAKTGDEEDHLNWVDANTAAESYGCVDIDGYAQNCWHLPTKSELNQLYEHKSVVGGFVDFGYWSSTEFNSAPAWFQNLIFGFQDSLGKDATLRVRAVRAF